MSVADFAIEPCGDAPRLSLDAHLGARVRDARRFRRMTQEDLGQKLDVSYQQVQKHETGAPLSAARLYRIAAILGIKPEWFFEGLDGYTKGEPPPAIDALGRRLLEAFDAFPNEHLRKLLVAFVTDLARQLQEKGAST